MAWQGRTAVVTGIARPAGIGQACAKLLFKQGYNIIGIDNKPPSFNDDVPWPMNTSPSTPAAVDGLQTQSPAPATTAQKIAWLTCDLSQQEHILSLDSQIAGLGAKSIDILVNNAGIADPYMQSDDLHQRALLWSNYIAVNLSAPFLLSELLVPLMPHGTSSIIHISSTRALQSEPHCEVSSYCLRLLAVADTFEFLGHACMLQDSTAAAAATIPSNSHADSAEVSSKPVVRVANA